MYAFNMQISEDLHFFKGENVLAQTVGHQIQGNNI